MSKKWVSGRRARELDASKQSSSGLLLAPIACVLVGVLVVTCYRPSIASAMYSVSAVNQLANVGFAYGLSPDRGKVSGRVTVNGVATPTIWSNGVATQFVTLSGFMNGEARDINDSGQVVGIAENVIGGFDVNDRAFYRSGGVTTQMPTFAGFGSTHAYGINNAGTVVGWSGFKPYRSQIGDASLTPLAGLPGSDGSGASWSANDAGDIVGWALDSNHQRQAVLWRGNAVTVLSAPSNSVRSEAHVITEDGSILGSAWYSGPHPSPVHAVRYSESGPAIDLGTLGGFYSEAFDINASGQIVGTSYLDNVMFKPAAFLYENGVMTDLNTLIPPGSGWDLQTAFSITDDGTIMGIGTFNGTPTGFLLSVPEPASATAIALLGLAVIGRRKRRMVG